MRVHFERNYSLGQRFTTRFLEAHQHYTFCNFPHNQTHLNQLISRDSRTRNILIRQGRHPKCALLVCLQEQGWVTLPFRQIKISQIVQQRPLLTIRNKQNKTIYDYSYCTFQIVNQVLCCKCLTYQALKCFLPFPRAV